MLTTEELTQLLKNRFTGLIEGFTSKAGSPFSAYLKLDEQNAIVFDFNNPAQTGVTPNNEMQDRKDE